MGRGQRAEIVFVYTDCVLELLYILGTSLSKGGLSLTIALLSLLCSGVDLAHVSFQDADYANIILADIREISTYRLPTSLALRRLLRSGVCLATLAVAWLSRVPIHTGAYGRLLAIHFDRIIKVMTT